MKLLKVLTKGIILEVSEKLKKQLLVKFKPTTEDSDETILRRNILASGMNHFTC